MISSFIPLEYTFAVSQVERSVIYSVLDFQYIPLIISLPLSHAAFNSSNPSSSSITQSIHFLLPIPMVPRIGTETRSPEEPSLTYSTFVAFALLCSEAGTGGIDILSLRSLVLNLGDHLGIIDIVYCGRMDESPLYRDVRSIPIQLADLGARIHCDLSTIPYKPLHTANKRTSVLIMV